MNHRARARPVATGKEHDNMLTVYGIRQCDTCRKAMKWLDGRIGFRFHDLRADGLDRALLEDWLRSEFAQQLVNRRSTTWRNLDEARKAAAGEALADLLLEFPTLIKRPVFVDGEVVAVGFGPETRARLLGAWELGTGN